MKKFELSYIIEVLTEQFNWQIEAAKKAAVKLRELAENGIFYSRRDLKEYIYYNLDESNFQ